MEGWKSSVFLAFLFVATVSAFGDRGCENIKCSEHPPGAKLPSPVNKCAYCCCLDQDGPAQYHECDLVGEYDPSTQKCFGRNMCGPCADAVCNDTCLNFTDYPVKNPNDICSYCVCHPNGLPSTLAKCPHGGMRYDPTTGYCVDDPTACPDHSTCEDIVCPPNMDENFEKRYPDPQNKCNFCCCRKRFTHARSMECPFHEKYDENVDDCVPDPTKSCPHPDDKPTRPTPTPPTPPTPTRPNPPPYDGCDGVPCPVDPAGAPLYPCGGQPQSYCQCEWGGKAHQMPCAGGTTFNFKYQTCL